MDETDGMDDMDDMYGSDERGAVVPRALRGWRTRRAERKAASAQRRDAWNLCFESIGSRIPTALVADSPTLMVAAVEDMCWQVARDTWRAARPSRLRRRAYRAWMAQYASLAEKRDRLRRMVDEALAVGTTGTPGTA
jgi:hypothetical protein